MSNILIGESASKLESDISRLQEQVKSLKQENSDLFFTVSMWKPIVDAYKASEAIAKRASEEKEVMKKRLEEAELALSDNNKIVRQIVGNKGVFIATLTKQQVQEMRGSSTMAKSAIYIVCDSIERTVKKWYTDDYFTKNMSRVEDDIQALEMENKNN